MNLAGIFVYWNRKASASARAAGARRPAPARARARGRSRTAMGALKRRETGSARAVMPGAQVRAPSIERLGLSGALCSATGSTAAYVACLGCGSATKTPVHSRIDASRWWLKTVHARGLWQPATVCWAEKLPAVHDDSDRALGSMLSTSAKEHWPFFVLRDSVFCTCTESAWFAGI